MEQPADFRRFYEATDGRPPRRTLLEALARHEGAPGFAVDLGCGTGRDAIELLLRGWSVLAIDAEAAALARLAARTDLPPDARLTALNERFEAARWPAADLVNASFALPLVPAEAFAVLWQKIAASLQPGGRFAGQLYGERDGWAGRPGITLHARSAALALLHPFTIELFDEEESETVTPGGKPKHWHIFHIVAAKR